MGSILLQSSYLVAFFDITMQHRKQIRLPIALIAIAILPALAHAQADTPARPTITVLPKADLDVNQWKETQFVAFDPHFKKEMPKRIARAHVLGAQVIMRELTGQKTTLSHQILSETIWLISSTADFKQIDERFDDLQATLDHPEREAQGAQQNSDGSSGAGYTQWFFQLIASYSHLNDPNAKYDFIDRINSPQKLTDYFVSISVSDIPRTGIDHEREFNESMSYLMRMILRQKPKAYHYDPKLKETLMDLLLHRFRNPTTGYWGESYVREGRVEFVDDLSMTFHIVSYLDGDVSDMDKVVATTLAIVDLEFPVGPVYKGERFDHLNMDVVELFRLGWPHASTNRKQPLPPNSKKCSTGASPIRFSPTARSSSGSAIIPWKNRPTTAPPSSRGSATSTNPSDSGPMKSSPTPSRSARKSSNTSKIIPAAVAPVENTLVVPWNSSA